MEACERQWELSDWLVDLLGNAASAIDDDPAEAARCEFAAGAIPGLHVDRLESIYAEVVPLRERLGPVAAARFVCAVLGVQ